MKQEGIRSYVLAPDAFREGFQNQGEEDYERTITRIVENGNACMPWAQDGEI